MIIIIIIIIIMEAVVVALPLLLVIILGKNSNKYPLRSTRNATVPYFHPPPKGLG
jgi:hypothetical protein